jgi:mitochondrial enoyl-[acyl-carrier protein] reductase / trans-2-enoyl-CoA reductase
MDAAHAHALNSRLVFEKTGAPNEVLALQTDLAPEPGLGEVRVKMLAAPINPADLNWIEGTYGTQADLPGVPGIEGCGEVEASGSADFQIGDRVIFLRRAGTWATQVTVAADLLFKLPLGITPQQAAMLKVNPATAWRLLHDFAELKRGAWIVQNAGNSAVGRCVIQLARDLGIRTISFVRRMELEDELRVLGADEIFPDDEAGHAAARIILDGATAALAFNAVGGESALRLMKLLTEGGSHITYGAMGRKPLTVPNGLLIFRDIRVCGLWVSRWIEQAPLDEVREVYKNLAARVVDGQLVQAVDSVFPLAEFPHALARLTASDRSGKVLFEM